MAAMFMASGDERAFYRAELRELVSEINAALPKTTDRTTKIHLEATLDQIGKILDPNAPSFSNPAANRFAMEFLELYLNPTSCWPDYSIEP
jgi:hypothetical protein